MSSCAVERIRILRRTPARWESGGCILFCICVYFFLLKMWSPQEGSGWRTRVCLGGGIFHQQGTWAILVSHSFYKCKLCRFTNHPPWWSQSQEKPFALHYSCSAEQAPLSLHCTVVFIHVCQNCPPNSRGALPYRVWGQQDERPGGFQTAILTVISQVQ